MYFLISTSEGTSGINKAIQKCTNLIFLMNNWGNVNSGCIFWFQHTKKIFVTFEEKKCLPSPNRVRGIALQILGEKQEKLLTGTVPYADAGNNRCLSGNKYCSAFRASAKPGNKLSYPMGSAKDWLVFSLTRSKDSRHSLTTLDIWLGKYVLKNLDQASINQKTKKIRYQ